MSAADLYDELKKAQEDGLMINDQILVCERHLQAAEKSGAKKAIGYARLAVDARLKELEQL